MSILSIQVKAKWTRPSETISVVAAVVAASDWLDPIRVSQGIVSGTMLGIEGDDHSYLVVLVETAERYEIPYVDVVERVTGELLTPMLKRYGVVPGEVTVGFAVSDGYPSRRSVERAMAAPAPAASRAACPASVEMNGSEVVVRIKLDRSAAVDARAVLVTQRNVEQVTGIPARQFREAVLAGRIPGGRVPGTKIVAAKLDDVMRVVETASIKMMPPEPDNAVANILAAWSLEKR